eukprot:TRINITY_DN7752_c0_g1_i1.p1 TRINITY_DN7752_c0_g1~~TRINITY_DN7752_c0_g1_i1.p1  ORF type:complete len:172 (+),score=23.62 TRINITY_DN7752_c0_g1_i1:111-626(+)
MKQEANETEEVQEESIYDKAAQIVDDSTLSSLQKQYLNQQLNIYNEALAMKILKGAEKGQSLNFIAAQNRPSSDELLEIVNQVITTSGLSFSQRNELSQLAAKDSAFVASIYREVDHSVHQLLKSHLKVHSMGIGSTSGNDNSWIWRVLYIPGIFQASLNSEDEVEPKKIR